MKKQYLFFKLALMIVIFGCAKEQSFTKSNKNIITYLELNYADTLLTPFKPIDEFTSEILRIEAKNVPKGRRSNMKINITIPSSAKIEPAFSGINDFSKPYIFYVIAENGDKRKYILDVYSVN